MTPKDILIAGAKELGITLSQIQVNSFFTHFSELKKWNNKINLTSIIDDRDVVIKHGLDSLAYTLGLTIKPPINLLDIGSGAGFPAVPLKIIFPEIQVTLVESVKKKAVFLRHIIRVLSLERIEVIDKRAEDLPFSFQGTFNVITARAFADIKSALSIGMPYLKCGGVVVLSRGPDETLFDHEVVNVGGVLEKKRMLTLPFSNYKRQIWTLKRSI